MVITPGSTSGGRGPLSGYRIVDFSENMAGPFATMILADQGADVVKVEPLRGDPLRHAGTGSTRMGAYFANLNRNKRSVAIDLRRPESADALNGLLDSADVVVQSFRPAAAKRLGIDAPTVRAGRPGLVHASIVGFGLTGPLAGMPVYDHVVQALSGIAAQQSDGPGSPPRLIRQGLIDKATGQVVAQSVCAALLERATTGMGAELSIAMLDVGLYFFWPDAMMNHTALDPEVLLPPASETFRLTQTADGHLAFVVLTDSQWAGLGAAIGLDITGMRRGDILRAVRSALAALTNDEAIAILRREDVACAPVVSQDDVASQPQVLANDSLGLYDHPAIGMLRQPNPVPRFPGVAPSSLRPAPLLGEHTDEVLGELGMAAEGEDLRACGVLGAALNEMDAT